MSTQQTASNSPSLPPSRTHDLKCWPAFFAPLWAGSKTFEIRKDDREPRFSIGDILHLREFKPCEKCKATGHIPDWPLKNPTTCHACNGTKGTYTGRMLVRSVNFIVRDHSGVASGYCVMAVTPI